MTSYAQQSHVSFGDTWTATAHNILLDNVHALWTNVAANGVPYFSTTDQVGVATLAAGKYLGLDASTDTPAALYPPGQLLHIPESIAPMSGINAAALQLIESSSTDTAKPVIYELLFDASTDEGRMWVFRLLNTPASAPILKFTFRMVSASSGNVVFVAQVAAISDGDTSVSAKAFGSANSATVAVPGSSNTQKEGTITLTNADSMAKGDWICLLLYRDADNGSDTATGDCAVNAVELKYG